LRYFDKRNYKIKKNVNYYVNNIWADKINIILTKFVIVGTLLIGIYSGGYPLLWLIAGDIKTYVDYGIPSFSGFINALYAIAVITFLIKRISQNKSILSLKLILYFIFPIIIGNRGLFFMVALQSFTTIYIFYNASIRKTLKGALSISLLIILFGIIGDFRINDFDHKIKRGIVKSEYQNEINILTSGFLWVYLYTTGSINNLNSYIDNVSPNYTPYYSISGILPSIIRSQIFKKSDYAFPMVNPMINTFTAYANYLTDFGIVVTLIIFSIIHFILVSLYFSLKRGNLYAIFGYSSLFSAHILSFFWDFYTIWFTIIQVLFTYYLINKKTIRSILTNNNKYQLGEN